MGGCPLGTIGVRSSRDPVRPRTGDVRLWCRSSTRDMLRNRGLRPEGWVVPFGRVTMTTTLIRALPAAILLAVSLAAPAAAEIINGTNGPDVLVGTPSADTIRGFGGNDTLRGRGGA